MRAIRLVIWYVYVSLESPLRGYLIWLPVHEHALAWTRDRAKDVYASELGPWRI